MVMNLMGVPTDLPIYDQQGNLISDPSFQEDFVEFSERESTEAEKQKADELITKVREQLAQVDDIGADLTVSDLVNAYSYASEEDDQEYFTVTVFGGKNGNGIWSNYLKVLADLVLRLESEFDDVWIRKWNIDTLDDVFDVEIAILTFA